jgi:outer membrane usher protein
MRRWLISLATGIAAACALGATARAEPMIAAVTLNGVDTGAVVSFERSAGGRLAAPRRDLRRIGLQLAPAVREADVPTSLSDVAGLRYRIDEASQTVELDADADLLAHHDLGPAQTQVARPDRSIWGAAVDYAVNLEGSRASGGLQARVFGPLGTLTHSFVVNGAGGRNVQRLDTSFTAENFERSLVFTAGDFVSNSAAVRAGGVRISTEPDLRPDLFAPPMVELSGQAATPSTVELYVDGVKRYSGAAAPGRFTARTTPTVNSRGEATLVVTDALGRQTTTTRAFYSASTLLRPGVTAFSLDAGALREGYAGPDDHYGAAFGAVALRRGISDATTLDGRAVISRQVRGAGIGVTSAVGRAALISASVDGSEARGRSGGQLRLAASSDGLAYGVWASLEHRTAGFAELGRDDAFDRDGTELQVGGRLRLERWGEISTTYAYESGRSGRYSLASAAWSKSLRGLHLYANVTAAARRYGGVGATLGFTAPFEGGGGLAMASVDTRDGGRLDVQAAKAAEIGGWGWRAASDTILDSGRARLEGEVRRLTPAGEAAVGVVADAKGADLRAYAAGSLIWIDGRPRATAHSGEGLTLIETGEPNVELLVENRAVGRTGRDGKLLAVNLPAAAASRIEINAASVPLEAEIERAEATVRPPRGGAARVLLPIRRPRNLQLQVVDESGRPLRVGVPVWMNGEAQGLVGFDGWIFLRNISDENIVEVEDEAGTCRFRLYAGDAGSPPPQRCDRVAPDDRLHARNRQPDPGLGGAELQHQHDERSDLHGLPGERRERQAGARRGDREVHLQRPGLPRLWVHLERSVRRLGLHREPPDEERRVAVGQAQLPAL